MILEGQTSHQDTRRSQGAELQLWAQRCTTLTRWVAKICRGDQQRHQQIRRGAVLRMCVCVCVCVSSIAQAYQAKLSKAVATSVHHFGPLGKRGKCFKEGGHGKFFQSFGGDSLNVLVPLQTLYVVAGRPLGKNCKWEGPDWYGDRALVNWLTVLPTRSRNRCEESTLHEPPTWPQKEVFRRRRFTLQTHFFKIFKHQDKQNTSCGCCCCCCCCFYVCELLIVSLLSDCQMLRENIFHFWLGPRLATRPILFRAEGCQREGNEVNSCLWTSWMNWARLNNIFFDYLASLWR